MPEKRDVLNIGNASTIATSETDVDANTENIDENYEELDQNTVITQSANMYQYLNK